MNDNQSYWRHSGTPLASLPVCEGSHQCDVVVIGGGFTGLSAALHIAQDGRQPIVLEAQDVGFGASGRNGGFVSGKFRSSLEGIAKSDGVETARRLLDLGHEAVEAVEQLVGEHGIADANYRRCGYIIAAHTPKAFGELAAGYEWQKRTLGSHGAELLAAGAMAERAGSPAALVCILRDYGARRATPQTLALGWADQQN